MEGTQMYILATLVILMHGKVEKHQIKAFGKGSENSLTIKSWYK